MNTKLATALLLASATGLAACAKKPPEQLPPPPSQTVTQPQTRPQVQPTGPSVGTQAHFAAAVGGSTTVYFDTDKYNIDSQDAAALQALFGGGLEQPVPTLDSVFEGLADYVQAHFEPHVLDALIR